MAITFITATDSTTATVNDSSHGALVGDFVTFSDAVSLGGNITAAILNQEYEIDTIINSNSYKIEAKNSSGGEITANSSDTGNGGSSTVAAYQINIGSLTNIETAPA